MQPSEDVIEDVRRCCIAAGLLREGENLDRSAHGAEMPLNQGGEDEYGEYDDYPDQGWEPKESVRIGPEEVRQAVAPFQCCRFGNRVGLHDVQASTERPAKVFAMTTTIICLTPFDETQHTSVKFQCVVCHDEFAAPVKEATKRRRAKEKNDQEKRLKRTVDSGNPVLEDFVSKVRRLKQLQLKKLCVANDLMVTGTKSELIGRLAQCLLYGHSGKCRYCRKSRMKLVFENPNSCEPTHVQCTYMYLTTKTFCAFGKQPIVGDRTLMLPHKLKDDVAGTLRSVGIEVGAAAAGLGV